MSKFTVKKDFWGQVYYYDAKGREIGKADTNLFGERIVRDRNGNKVGIIGHDLNGRLKLTKFSTSIFSTDEIMTVAGAPEDWEYCDNCGEWADDDHCDSCGY